MSSKKVQLFSDNEEDNIEEEFNNALSKTHFQGKKGQMLMELEKTYKHDKRFALNKKFSNDIDIKKIPSTVKGMSKVFDKKNNNTYDYEDNKANAKLNEECLTEKNNNLSILSQVISNSDFLTKTKRFYQNPKNLIIKRFDPRLGMGKDLVVQTKEEKQEDLKINNLIKLDKGVGKAELPVQVSKKDKKNKNPNKKEKERQIEKVINELNDNLEAKVEINYNSWKGIINQPDESVFSLFGDEIKTKKKDEKKDVLIKNNTIEEKEESNNEEDSEMLRKKKKREKKEKKREKEKEREKEKKIKDREKREQMKINEKLKDEKIEQVLKTNLMKEFDEEKVENYMRYVNMVREKNINKGKKTK